MNKGKPTKIVRQGKKITTRCYVCQDHVVDLEEHRKNGCKAAEKKKCFNCQEMVDDLTKHRREKPQCSKDQVWKQIFSEHFEK